MVAVAASAGLLAGCTGEDHAPVEATTTTAPETTTGPLVDDIYTADPSGHVWDGTLYVYPSHDVQTNVPADRDGSQYAMTDYHVLSLAAPTARAADNGVALALADVPWASKQLWAPDAARKGGTYFLYFPARDKKGVFRIGVATSSSPTGPFTADPEPIAGSYSIDPAVFTDDDGATYMYFGGLIGGELQRYRDDKPLGHDEYPADDAPALGARVVRLSDDLHHFAEPTREVVVLDENGKPLTAGDDRAFFEGSWMSKRDGTYYFMWSTGPSHHLAYATGSSPYGPFAYRGIVLDPVDGWTTHGSMVEFDDQWYLLYHSARRSGQDNLRDVLMAPLEFEADGSIRTITP